MNDDDIRDLAVELATEVVEQMNAFLMAIIDGAAKGDTDELGLVHYDVAVSPEVARRIDELQETACLQ